jgi:hypothetical protein
MKSMTEMFDAPLPGTTNNFLGPPSVFYPAVSLLHETNSHLLALVEMLANAQEQPPGIAALQDPIHQRQLLSASSIGETATSLKHKCAAPTPLPPHDQSYRRYHHSFLIVEHDPFALRGCRRNGGGPIPGPSGRPPERPPSCSTRWR